MKHWYESITLWSCIGLILLALGNLFFNGGSFKETAEYFLVAMMGLGLRRMNRKIKGMP